MKISSLQFRSRQNRKERDKAISSLGYPVIFHWITLVILLGILILAAFKQMVPLLASTGFFLVLATLPRLWSYYALKSLSGKIGVSHDRAFPGEEVELALEVVNKGLPLPWLEIELELPFRLLTGKSPSSPYTWKRLRWVTVLARGQAITWKHNIKAEARGEYELGPLRMTSGDMFGLFPKELVIPDLQSLLVYPKILPMSRLNLPLKALLGEKAASRTIYEDVSRVAGARDYRYDDSFKRIHWKASAARNQLQTRQYESSTSLNLLIIFDGHSFPEEDDVFEDAVSTVASLAYEAEQQGFAVGLIINGEPEVQIAIAGGRKHLMQIMEALARVKNGSKISLYQQMDKFRTMIPMGATLVILTRRTTDAFSGLAYQLKQDGHPLLCISMEQISGKEGHASIAINGEVHS